MQLRQHCHCHVDKVGQLGPEMEVDMVPKWSRQSANKLILSPRDRLRRDGHYHAMYTKSPCKRSRLCSPMRATLWLRSSLNAFARPACRVLSCRHPAIIALNRRNGFCCLSSSRLEDVGMTTKGKYGAMSFRNASRINCASASSLMYCCQ